MARISVPSAPSFAAPVERVGDYMSLAQTGLEPAVWRYLHEGSDDAVAQNQRALAAVRVIPHPLRDLRGGHTRLTLLGQELAHPLVLAPIAYQRLLHTDGENASAMAASAQGGQMLVSSLASQSFSDIVQASRAGADAAGGNRAGPWFQLYWQGERERSLRLMHRAIAAGCSAVVLTVDAPIKLASMRLPGGVSAVNLEPPNPAPLLGPTQSRVFDGWMSQAPTWDDLAWLRAQTSCPLLLKGILDADDAERALTLGCDGLVVSNHGGRVLDGAPSSFDVLPEIAQRIQGRIPILLDSGIRSGREVFVALAMGARAVLIGRPYLWGLASGGAMGVAHTIRLLRDELEMTMALAGCARLDDIALDCLRRI